MWTAATTTRMLYDGDELVAEYSAPATGTPVLLRRYVHGAGSDDPLIWYEGAGIASTALRRLRSNHQGSIVAVTDNAGTAVAINAYDEWGIPAAANQGRFQYTGQAWIPELGLYYYKARIYSPTLGRFMQTDPIGYEDQVNLYAYVGNDPVNAVDPTGLSCEGLDGGDTGAFCDRDNPEDDGPPIDVTAPVTNDRRNNPSPTGSTRELDVNVLNPVTAAIHYVIGGGETICLSRRQFQDIVNNSKDAADSLSLVRGKTGGSGLNGFKETSNSISTYASGIRLGKSIGSATLYREASTGTPTGFYDRYNFDSKSSGARSDGDEAATSAGSYIPGVDFDIKYPC